MRAIAVLSAAAFLLTAGTAWACPMEQTASASKSQTVVSSGSGQSTPIPAKSQQGGNG
jgi:hypothetical protein